LVKKNGCYSQFNTELAEQFVHGWNCMLPADEAVPFIHLKVLFSVFDMSKMFGQSALYFT